MSVTWREGFYAREATATEAWRWASQEARLVVTNPAHHARELRIEFSVDMEPEYSVTRTEYGGGPERLTVESSGATVRFDLRVDPGTNEIILTTDAPRVWPDDPRDLHMRIINPVIADAVLVDLTAEPEG